MALMVTSSSSLPNQPTSSLTQALQDFEGSLSASQKQEYNANCVKPNPFSVLTFVAKVDGEKNGRARRCFAPRLCSFLESTEQFAGVVETFVSSNPTIAALVWGGVKMAVLAASNVASYFDKVTSMIMSIGRRCPTLQKFGCLYPTSIDLQVALCEYYALVVRFCAKIIEVSQRSTLLQTLSSVFQPFETEFESFRDSFDEAATTVQTQIDLASKQEARTEARLSELERIKNANLRRSVFGFQKKSKEEQAQARKWRVAVALRQASQMRSEILTNLTKVNYKSPWKQATRERLPGTAEWFEQDHAFLDWRSASGSPTFWCFGNMGMGKTVLAANVVAHLFAHREPTDVIAFFFCRAEEKESHHAREVLGSIAAQMLENQLRLLEDDALFQTHQESQNLDASDLVEFLRVRLLPTFTYYVVLDGLDECETVEIDMIVNAVNRIRTRHEIEFKVMLVGRPELERQLFGNQKATYKMNLSRTNVEADVQQYIELTLEECLENNKLRLGDPQLILQIRPALKDGADGMILWARLLIEEICTHNSDSEILQALHNLPQNLSVLFDRKVERLKARAHAEGALKTLQFCGIARRPMTTDEIREALTIRFSQTSLDFGSISNDFNQIIADCCGLAYVDEEDATVHYIHHSVYQHLFESTHPSSAHFDKMAQDKHLGLLCLTYVNFNDFRRQLAKSPKGSNIRIDPLKIGATAITGLPETSNRLALRLLRSGHRSPYMSARDLQRKTEELLGVEESARLQSDLKLRQFQFLAYARKYWIYHLNHLTKADNQKLWPIFGQCVDGTISIVDRPWETPDFAAQADSIWKERSKSDIRWLVHNHHTALLLWKISVKDSSVTDEDLGKVLLQCSVHDDLYMMDCLIEHTQPATDQVNRALVVAAGCGFYDGAERLLKIGANVYVFWEGRTALQAAAGGGHLDAVERLIIANANVNAAAAKNGGRTALQAAGGGGHFDVVERLLTANADVNAAAAKYRGQTALQAAAGGGYFDVEERLLTAAKADDNAAAAKYRSRMALQAAAGGGHLDVVERLLMAKADVNATAGYDGRTALQAAAGDGHFAVVERLLTAKADVNATAGHDGRTALQAAAGGGHLDVVERLLTAKTDVNAAAAKDDGQTALQAAAGGGHLNVVERLLKANADVNAADNINDRTALQAAAEGGHLDVVERLLTANADVNAAAATKYGGRTALQAAAGGGYLDVIERLLTAKADVNAAAAEMDGRTALQAAAGGGRLDVVEKLLTAKADVNAAAAKYGGPTALQAAAGGGHFAVVERLLKANADVNAADNVNDRTALQAAAGGGHLDVVERLLTAKADVNATARYDGPTALQAAAGGGYFAVVERLLTAKADVNAAAAKRRGQTALQAAAGGGHLDVVERLLTANADVNAAAATGYGGRTALEAAAGADHLDVVERLLTAKADVNATAGKSGRTALQAAAGRGHLDVVERLLTAKADVNAAAATGYGGRTALEAAGGHQLILKRLKDAGAR